MLLRWAMLAVVGWGFLTQGADAADKSKGRPNKDRSDKIGQAGAQIGDSIPALTVFDLKGQKASLNEQWKTKPTLIVTASVTCPIARGRQSGVDQLAEKLAGKINIVMLYTIEAHPKGDPSPYSDKEWTVSLNERQGIGYRQPTALERRIELAKDYIKRVNLKTPLLVDAMDNTAWKALGEGPNLGILITPEGKVALKQPWIDPQSMTEQIQQFLQKSAGK